MKGLHYPDILWKIGFRWETSRNRSLEGIGSVPKKKIYDFMVTHPALPNWGFRDCWDYTYGEYEGTNTSYRSTSQRDMANHVMVEATRSFLESWKLRYNEEYRP
jgi:hypothetical protein